MSTQVTNHTPPASNNTKLKDRTLWFDGDSTYRADEITKALIHDSALFVDELTADIKRFNLYVPPEQQLRVKQDTRPLNFNWMIPDQYKKLDIVEYVVEKLDEQKITDPSELKARAVRVAKELKLYEQHDLLDVLRVLIYVINTLNSNSVVWGVGRGSSVSSYVLYLIGIHDVDSVKYELDIEDFLH